jgi:hypothetical protein
MNIHLAAMILSEVIISPITTAPSASFSPHLHLTGRLILTRSIANISCGPISWGLISWGPLTTTPLRLRIFCLNVELLKQLAPVSIMLILLPP